MKAQPAYPFYTRFGKEDYNTQFAAWISDEVVIRVVKPQPWNEDGGVECRRKRFKGEMPNFNGDNDVLVTRDEFMAAYNAAEAFLQAAAREFLPVTAPALITSAQAEEITQRLNHPAFDRRAKTKWLLGINKMTHADAQKAIAIINDTRAMFDQVEPVGTYAVKGEAYRVTQSAA